MKSTNGAVVSLSEYKDGNAVQALAPQTCTHEEYFAAVRDLLVARVAEPAARQRLAAAKVVYGAGNRGARGVTFFAAWHDGAAHQDVLQVCADGEETSNALQLPGTTIHEAAHVVAGPAAGHGPAWKAAAAALGLVHAEAAGQSYEAGDFAPEVFAALSRIASPTDGQPVFRGRGGEPTQRQPRPCQLGIGTRGGKSRGTGSGSRLRLWVCECPKPVKVRVASDDFQATCGRCGQAFKRG